MKLDRLVGILVILLGKERVSARELAERFGVSTRTILRDVEAINLAGIPIVTYQGEGGGISIAEGYRLDRSVLSGEDMASILGMLKGIDGAVSSRKHEILIEKLKNSLTSPQREKLEANLNRLVIDFSPWRQNEAVKKKLALINKAVDESLELEFSYVDMGGQATRRTVEPYSLILKAQVWYLYAWCLLREDFRYFRISRMSELSLSGVTFKQREMRPPPQRSGDGDWNKAGDMTALELAFDREMESVVRDTFSEEIETLEDGRLLVRLALPESNWMYGYLLSFGSTLEVLSPEHVRKGVSESAKAIVKKYNFE